MSTPQAATRSRLPKPVQRQIEDAEKILSEINAPPAAAEPAQPAATPDQPTAPAAAAPTEPAAPVTTLDQPAAPAAVAAPVAAPEEDFKQRYMALRGKYDKELPEERAKNAELTQRLQQMETLLSQMADKQREPESRVTKIEGNKLPKPASFSEKEMAEFGEEFMDVAGRRAAEIFEDRFAPLKKRLDEMDGKREQDAQLDQQRARVNLELALEEQVPNWKAQNTDPAFLAWLREPDVFSGWVRQELLTKASLAGDAARVVRFFKAFQEDAARQPAPVARQPAVDAGTLVAPGTPRGAPAAAPGGTTPEMWTQAEIAQFYSDVRRGKVTAEDRKRIEAAIIKAASEGRVR